MLKSSCDRDKEMGRHGDGVNTSRILPVTPYSCRLVLRPAFCLLLPAYCLVFAVACRQDMQDQPKMIPFRATTFFSNGTSARSPVAGTVPRGYLKADREFFTGKKSGSQAGTLASAVRGQRSGVATPSAVAGSNATSGASAYPDDVEVFPIPITQEIVRRGKERYEIFCSVCHGLTGNGDGMIVRRGFRRAASFHDDRLRQAPVGHYFDAITNGWGAMPSYAVQIPAQDRWAIVAYIRALQLSQQDLRSNAAQSQAPANQPTTPAGGHQK
jgi:mono/diheme cytochrome c family protein